MSILDTLSSVVGLKDKAQTVVFSVVALLVFVLGFIMGSWMGNPTINIYTQDGKKTEVKWEGQPKDLPQIISESYPEGSNREIENDSLPSDTQ